MFRGAAIYGVLALVPLYFLPMPAVSPETYYGFIGCALVFQWLFWIIGGDPVKYRPLMLVAVAEKLVFAVPALALIGGREDTRPHRVLRRHGPFARHRLPDRPQPHRRLTNIKGGLHLTRMREAKK